ncbi:uncharacterized protein I206_102793 [Kwoniella pini CBS 10737]|uniref:Uncharacterized protein n=1 Tax=Kwoniella pini CBS 10737 TaxID=1296096 RepID=A0A1B9I6H0_9TREE|nr:uncharacterized protein I206_03147 [Kwoniella pini CBS 10737]OCF51081.1 hypothetical protein I206_03147 [Kwoniella pini CBS 10737]
MSAPHRCGCWPLPEGLHRFEDTATVTIRTKEHTDDETYKTAIGQTQRSIPRVTKGKGSWKFVPHYHRLPADKFFVDFTGTSCDGSGTATQGRVHNNGKKTIGDYEVTVKWNCFGKDVPESGNQTVSDAVATVQSTYEPAPFEFEHSVG